MHTTKTFNIPLNWVRNTYCVLPLPSQPSETVGLPHYPSKTTTGNNISRNMGLFCSVVKEAWEKKFLFTKFLCFLHVIDNYLVDPVKIYGPNMLPVINLNPSIFLAERITLRSGKITLRDILVFCSPQNPRRTVTKRVIRLEGDSITYVSNLENSDNDKHEKSMVPKGHV
ncbi:hypothetical protein RYX36_012425 [Vicia faba]